MSAHSDSNSDNSRIQGHARGTAVSSWSGVTLSASWSSLFKDLASHLTVPLRQTQGAGRSITHTVRGGSIITKSSNSTFCMAPVFHHLLLCKVLTSSLFDSVAGGNINRESNADGSVVEIVEDSATGKLSPTLLSHE
jgi:hypothetical protein